MKKDYMQSKEVLGSSAELRLSTADLALAEKWFEKLWNEIQRFDDKFSRFKKDSELTGLNDRAGERVQISEEFEIILKRAKEFSRTTGGIFNPFILPSLQKSGYLDSLNGGEPAPDYSAREVADWRLLETGGGFARIPKNTAIDLGGIGKGFLADKLARMVEGEIPDYCLSLGGDMRVGGQSARGPWQIEVAAPGKTTEPKILFSNPERTWGIATSGAERIKNNRKQKHIIDPSSGLPLANGALCTVAAKDTTVADVLASCILIGGRDFAKSLYHSGEIDALLIQEKDGDFILGKGFSKISSYA